MFNMVAPTSPCLAKKSTLPRSSPQSRIPVALQAVFLASNRGQEVHVPPVDGTAHQVFLRNWFHQQNSGSLKRMAPGKSPATTKAKLDRRILHALAFELDGSQHPQTTSDPAYTMTPQQYLDAELSNRGYPVSSIPTLKTAYYNTPTTLQRASYSQHVVRLANHNNTDKLRTLLAQGVSPNACNEYGESLLHHAARKSQYDVLRLLLQFHANVRVCDDYGRTPLHDACWRDDNDEMSLDFDIVDLLLMQDIMLLRLQDKHGSRPLDYVPVSMYDAWIMYLSSRLDIYWPAVVENNIKKPDSISVSSLLVTLTPNTCPIPDPCFAGMLPVSLSDVKRLVSDGDLQVSTMLDNAAGMSGPYVTDEDDDVVSLSDEEDDDDDDGESLSSYDSSDEEESDDELLQSLPVLALS